MSPEIPASARPHLYAGSTFFDLARGTSVYAGARAGQEATATCGAALVTVTVESATVGPLGQFLAPGIPHASGIGRTFDVRALADAIEAKFSTGAKDRKVLDPRELYTAITYRVVDVRDPAPVMPVPAV